MPDQRKGEKRDPVSGRFLPGNCGGPGNPYLRLMARFRGAVAEAVTPEQIREVMGWLYTEASKGSVPAMREFLDRTVGKAVPSTEHEAVAQAAFAQMMGDVIGTVRDRAPSTAVRDALELIAEEFRARQAIVVDVES
jgi:hypothetical protein